MKKLYAVEMKVVAVVQAEDEAEAKGVVQGERLDILMDAPFVEAHVLREVTKLSELPDTWDGDCVPHGMDRCVRISELLP